MRGITILFWGFVTLCVAKGMKLHKIPEHVTFNERLEVLGATGAEAVPDYEIPPPHSSKIAKRSADIPPKFLTPWNRVLVKEDTPIYSLVSGNAGPIITKRYQVNDFIKSFADLENAGVTMINNRSDSYREIVANMRKVRSTYPMPAGHTREARIPQKYMNDRESKSDDVKDTVHQREVPVVDDELSLLALASTNTSRPRVARETRTITVDDCKEEHRGCLRRCGNFSTINPQTTDQVCLYCQRNAQVYISACPVEDDTVYPRILVVLAHEFFERFGKNYANAIAYVLEFWNGVDLKFRSFEEPQFRLHIMGIVVTEDAEALEYFSKFTLDKTTLVGDSALKASGYYWYDRKTDIPYESYDLTMTMTTKALCSYQNNNETCTIVGQGASSFNGACSVNLERKHILHVSIIQDDTAFSGVLGAAHEIGHLFGVHHDADTDECSHLEGYMMGKSVGVATEHHWSPCSIKEIRQFVQKRSTCGKTKISMDKVLPVYLPGKFVSTDEQCRRTRGTSSCIMGASICRTLPCTRITKITIPAINQVALFSECVMEPRPAADGTICESGKICLNGECVDESTLT
ncbi:A disintegrin and metalloproteinase with thrombospondin motifs like [Diachasmimorpha longicaudata]|uniref:A disintegrin and metalloproteinase with thrombospondin motifs like n=1 Tax=Diachasmimorpha longicaudata TaxID=58733 RepID=UPI0030B8E4E5